MATASTQLMTAEDFWEFVQRPENRDRNFELVRGEVVEVTKPGKRHGFVCTRIGAILDAYAARQKKGYACGNDTGMIVSRDPDSVCGPDVLFFEDATTFEQVDVKWGSTIPRLAVEVLSPSNNAVEMNERIQDQLEFGTPLVWVVDPESKTVTVYRSGRNLVVHHVHEELMGEDVLPDFRCRISEFFTLPGQSS